MGTSDILLGGGGTLQWTNIPSRGGVGTLLGMLHVKETGISPGRLGLWLVCAFIFFFYYSKIRQSCAGAINKMSAGTYYRLLLGLN